jgi:hypothetical protein
VSYDQIHQRLVAVAFVDGASLTAIAALVYAFGVNVNPGLMGWGSSTEGFIGFYGYLLLAVAFIEMSRRLGEFPAPACSRRHRDITVWVRRRRGVQHGVSSHDVTPIATHDHAPTRDRILDAARRLVAQHNPGALSVATIAEEAGVSHRNDVSLFATGAGMGHRARAAGASVSDAAAGAGVDGRPASAEPVPYILDFLATSREAR